MTLTFLLSLLLAAAPQCAPVPPLELPAAQEMLEARRKALTQRLNREAEPACRQALGTALGETLLAVGRAEEAIEPLTWAALEPAAGAAARALRLLGEAYLRQGSTSEALECYLEAARLDPTGPEGREAWQASAALARFRVRAAWRPTDAYALDPDWRPQALPRGQVRAVALSPSGELALVTKKGLVRLGAQGQQTDSRPLEKGRAVCFDAGGGLWLGTRRRVIGPDGPLELAGPSHGSGKLDVEALAVDSRGRLLVVSDGEALLYESLSAAPISLGRATDVAPLEDGFALLDRKLREVRLWPKPRRIDLRQVLPEIREPEALASDRFGNLYLLDRKLSAIVVHTLDGELLARVPWSAELRLKNARDLAVDRSGRITILTRGGEGLARLH